jgi:hypothetical protein
MTDRNQLHFIIHYMTVFIIYNIYLLCFCLLDSAGWAVLVAMAIEKPLAALVSKNVLNRAPVTLLNITRALLESSIVYT